MSPILRHLLAAQGFSELEMFDEALAEIEALPEQMRNQPATIETRMFILMRAKRWAEALEASLELCRLRPEDGTGHLHAAFCLHELGRTQEARTMLLSGPARLRDQAVFYYNLACYDAVLGNAAEAVRNLRESIRLDEKFRQFAQIDPDLKTVRGIF